MAYETDYDLDSVLMQAEAADLGILIDHITDRGEGRLTLSSDIKDMLISEKKSAEELSGNISQTAREMVSAEIRSYGGNTIMNLFRGGSGVSYKEVLCDVADHVKARYQKDDSCAQVEQAMLLKLLEKSMEKMSSAELKSLFESLDSSGKLKGMSTTTTATLQAAIGTSGFAAYTLAAIVAQATAKTLLGRGLAFGTTAPLVRSVGVLAGPIGWAITGIWTAFDLASPAYRVTVPCTVQIAYMRQKMLASQSRPEASGESNMKQQRKCRSCGSLVSATAKFCGECGQPTAILLNK